MLKQQWAHTDSNSSNTRKMAIIAAIMLLLVVGLFVASLFAATPQTISAVPSQSHSLESATVIPADYHDPAGERSVGNGILQGRKAA
jgi:hypothetical protein